MSARRERQAVVDLGQDQVLFFEDHVELLAEDLRVQQVLDADAHPGRLVGVGGADAAFGGAQLVPTEVSLGQGVDLLVVGHDQVGPAGDAQARAIDAGRGEFADLRQQDSGVDDHPVADDRDDVVVEDAARAAAGGRRSPRRRRWCARRCGRPGNARPRAFPWPAGRSACPSPRRPTGCRRRRSRSRRPPPLAAPQPRSPDQHSGPPGPGRRPGPRRADGGGPSAAGRGGVDTFCVCVTPALFPLTARCASTGHDSRHRTSKGHDSRQGIVAGGRRRERVAGGGWWPAAGGAAGGGWWPAAVGAVGGGWWPAAARARPAAAGGGRRRLMAGGGWWPAAAGGRRAPAPAPEAAHRRQRPDDASYRSTRFSSATPAAPSPLVRPFASQYRRPRRGGRPRPRCRRRRSGPRAGPAPAGR